MARTTTSYVHGTSPEPLIGQTIGSYFDAAADEWPDNDCLVVRHQGIRWTYREFRAQVDALASGLLALGLCPKDRVGIWSPNNAEWEVAQFATAKAGLILVNINPAYRIAELTYALNKVGCKALITASHFKTSDYGQMLREVAPELSDCEPGKLKSAELPKLKIVIQLSDSDAPGTYTYNDVLTAGGDVERRQLAELSERLQFDDPINIQFTSGTTGTPKAATLTHHNILNNAYFAGRAMAFTEADRLCIPVPMYHCFGMVLGSLACVAHGAAMVYPSEGFDAAAVLQTIEAERCTALHGVPTMFIAELEQPDFRQFDLSSLRTGIMAGAPCPVELMKRVITEMHLDQITIAYGMTETGPLSFETSPEDSIERRVTTVGKVLPHTEVKIVDSDGRIVPVGTIGELKTRGYCVMRGYWGDPVKTDETIDDAGWIASSDLATIDADGYCRIVGRLKDMVIRGGENLFPREIEEYLFRHSKVEEAEVFGVPDPKYGEELCAWIKLRPGETVTEAEIRDFCQGRIAHFKIPKYIRFVDEYPMTVTGKVQKYKMREKMIEELGLAEEAAA